jgi:hypothetical protein
MIEPLPPLSSRNLELVSGRGLGTQGNPQITQIDADFQLEGMGHR